MIINATDMISWLSSFMLPLFRIAALVTAAPIFGSRMLPTRMKLLFSIALTLLIVPLAPAVPAFDMFSPAGMLVVAQQVIIGLCMGFALQLVYQAFVYAGQVVALTMGLGFASLNDPSTGVVVPTVSQFYTIMISLVFFAIGGHLVMIEVLVDSFTSLPVGMQGISSKGLWSLLSWGSYMFAGAVLIVLPAIAAMLVVNIGFGILMRSSPQLNIFAVGFPVIMTFGFVVIYISLPNLLPQMNQLLAGGFSLMRSLAGGG